MVAHYSYTIVTQQCAFNSTLYAKMSVIEQLAFFLFYIWWMRLHH